VLPTPRLRDPIYGALPDDESSIDVSSPRAGDIGSPLVLEIEIHFLFNVTACCHRKKPRRSVSPNIVHRSILDLAFANDNGNEKIGKHAQLSTSKCCG